MELCHDCLTLGGRIAVWFFVFHVNVTYMKTLLQLGHFGEVFDSRKCKMSLASCDNCKGSGQQEKKDVTILAKSIIKG